MIGLLPDAAIAKLNDPVTRIIHSAASLLGVSTPDTSRWLVLLFSLFHASRHLLSLRVTAALATKVAAGIGRRRTADSATASELGRQVHAVECRSGMSDCYPRALMTGFLSVARGRGCTIVLGVLAPTRKLHAWCVIDGDLPYEPIPEHYLFEPVWALDIRPR